MERTKQRATGAGIASVLLFILLLAAFFMGGGSRDDIASLVILRPITALLFVSALAFAAVPAWRAHRALLATAASILIFTLFHLFPLPPALWSSMSGRQSIVEVYRLTGPDLPWHSLSVAPQRTWNAFFALLAPAAALFLAASLSTGQLIGLIRPLIALGLLSGVIGVLQLSGVTELYFYQITNRGSAVGLFANRNHQAILLTCLFPLLAASARMAVGGIELVRMKRRMAVAAGVFVMAMVVVTGSRAGFLTAGVALPLALWTYVGKSDAGPTRWRLPLIVLTGTVFLTGLFAWQSRAPAVERLLDTGGESELRIQAAPAIWQATRDFFPWGSGFGSFVEIYRAYEPQELLSFSYLNHAHNDWLELLLVGGLPVAVLMLAFLVLMGRSLVALMKTSDRSDAGGGASRILGRAGLSVTFLFCLASLVDYPLRTPALAVFAAIAVIFMVRGLAAARAAPASDTPGDTPSRATTASRNRIALQ